MKCNFLLQQNAEEDTLNLEWKVHLDRKNMFSHEKIWSNAKMILHENVNCLILMRKYKVRRNQKASQIASKIPQEMQETKTVFTLTTFKLFLADNLSGCLSCDNWQSKNYNYPIKILFFWEWIVRSKKKVSFEFQISYSAFDDYPKLQSGNLFKKFIQTTLWI